MIRIFIEWLLYILHIKKKEGILAIECLERLMPVLFAAMIVLGMNRLLGALLPRLPWYRRIWQSIKARVRYVRAVVVGY